LECAFDVVGKILMRGFNGNVGKILMRGFNGIVGKTLMRGFNGIYLVRLGFRMWEILIFK